MNNRSIRSKYIARFVGIVVLLSLMVHFVMAQEASVATVNGEDITESAFRDRVAFEQVYVLIQAQTRYSQAEQQAAAFGMDVDQVLGQDRQFQQWDQELQFPDVLGARVLNDMIDDVLIRQEFDARGLFIDEPEVSAAQQKFFGIDLTQVAQIGTPASPTVTETPNTDANAVPPSPTPSQQELLDDYYGSMEQFSQSLQNQGVSQTAIDDFWRRQAIQRALADDIVGALEMATFANARHILLETEEEANQVMESLRDGAEFADLAAARSLDTGSGSRGGELGWQPIDLYVPSFADAVRDAPIGEIIGPIESLYGFHIVQVLEREERPVEDSRREQVAAAIFTRWLDEQREAAEAAGQITINSDWPDFMPER